MPAVCLTNLRPQPLCYSRVIGGTVLKRFPCQALPILHSLFTADIACQVLEQLVVVTGIYHNSDMAVVLRCSSDHSWTTCNNLYNLHCSKLE